LCVDVVEEGEKVAAEKAEETKGVLASVLDTIGAVAASVVEGIALAPYHFSI
jgi:hypothetical protein